MRDQELLKCIMDAEKVLPRTPEEFERLAREFDVEVHAYFADRGGKGDTPAEPISQSPHELFHGLCFTRAQAAVKKLRDPKNDSSGWTLEGLGLIAQMEDHCIQLTHPEVHRLSPIHAATNRAVWQGANGLVTMALALRPNSPSWMDCERSWIKGCAAVAAGVAVLRVRRAHPAELLFDDPNNNARLMDFANNMMGRNEEITATMAALLQVAKP